MKEMYQRQVLKQGNGQYIKFVDWYTSANFSYVIGDATHAYDASVSKWERKILHVDKSYFILVDKLVKEKADSIPSFLYHTTSPIFANEKILMAGEKTEENRIDFRGEISLPFILRKAIRKN